MNHSLLRLTTSCVSLLLLLFAVVFAQPHAAQAGDTLYVIRGSRGAVTFTSRQPSSGQSYSVFAPRSPAFSRYYSLGRTWKPRMVSSAYDNLIYGMAELYDLDPALVKAVVHVESAFNAQARSPKGAMGLMQLMPGTARRFGVDTPYKPEENVRGGVTYLKLLHDRYSGDVRLALAAYNAGEGSVDRYRGIPAFPETQQYVRKVMRMREVYSCALAGRKNCAG